MLDVLMYLLDNYVCINSCPQISVLTNRLKNKGFGEYEIKRALNWLSDLLAALRHLNNTLYPEGRVRVFSKQERARFDQDCFHLLMSMESANLLTPGVRELILERAMAFDDYSIELEQFKVIVLLVLWSQNKKTDWCVGLLSDSHKELSLQ